MPKASSAITFVACMAGSEIDRARVVQTVKGAIHPHDEAVVIDGNYGPTSFNDVDLPAEMTVLRSRLSAEHPNREERDGLLESVRTKGYASGYRGLRIAKSGRRFWIENVTVWNLINREGVYCGQAATYRQWKDV